MSDRCDAVVNLAGAWISRSWSASYKRIVVLSRIDTTRMPVQAMVRLEHRPQTFISTPAIGAFDAAASSGGDSSPGVAVSSGGCPKGLPAHPPSAVGEQVAAGSVSDQ